MRIVSTNLSKPKEIQWRGKTVITGIFKEPIEGQVTLGEEDVEGDSVIDRKYHGGVDQACYLYSAEHYDTWKEIYPDLDFPFGMFGENLTVDDLDERETVIGSVYKLGTAKVQISAPRQPCYKLGVKFNDQGVLKVMINNGFCGTYVRVQESGQVKKGDVLELMESVENGISIREAFRAIYDESIGDDLKKRIVADQHMPENLKVKLVSRHGAY